MIDLSSFNQFLDFFKDIKIINKKLNQTICKFTIHFLFDNFHNDQSILQLFKKSKVAILDKYKTSNQNEDSNFFMICFENVLIIFNENNISFITRLFEGNPNIKACFLSDIKEKFTLNIKTLQISSFFEEEIRSFQNQLKIQTKAKKSIHQIWKNIQRSLSSYFISNAYEKLSKNRIKFFDNKEKKLTSKIIQKDDYIKLRNVGNGSFFIVSLIYHIEEEELYAIKESYGNSLENMKLKEREISNYSKVKNPFLPKFIGETEDKSIVIEYINGESLLKINKFNLEDKEKFEIILELMLIISYLHQNHLIYRDLKPNNIILDQNKIAVLIDFDRMIDQNGEQDKQNYTSDFGSAYVAPEVNYGELSYSCDIYSLGMVIFFIMNERIDQFDDNNERIKKLEKYPEIQQMFVKCTKESPKERPNIAELIQSFYTSYHSKLQNECLIEEYFALNHEAKDIQILLNEENEFIQNYLLNNDQNDPKTLFNLGAFYEDGQEVPKDINKAIYFYSLAAQKNFPQACFNLGSIYEEGKYVKTNINKAIHYYNLAANQGLAEALFCLGRIYFYGQVIHQDIEKAIHYFQLAAEKNNKPSLFMLGNFYYEVQRDIQKSIHYFSLASDLNEPNSQFMLGIIYFENILIQRDIQKAIHYFELAAKQNLAKAQHNLGMIYSTGEYVPQDLKKAIHYYTMAAEQNFVQSQFNLGIFYELGQFVKRDINKAIYFYTLAANQNFVQAQFNLAYIYWEGLYIEKNIQKTIEYFTLASKQNHREAQYNLGLIYERNQDVSRDIEKAIHYYTLAANQNDKNSQFKLGVIYLSGRYNVKRDIAKSIHYFNLAAKQNDPEAQFNLGCIYETGSFVPIDISSAIYYYSQAANQNYAPAEANLGVIYYKRKEFKKAIHFLTLAAYQKDPQSLFLLGQIYYSNNDIPNAIHYYTLAAVQNNPEAQFILGKIYFFGKYIAQDFNKAIHYYTFAAKQNHSSAQLSLGMIYFEGLFVNKNLSYGVSLLSLSSKNGNRQASFTLGYYYHEGRSINRDIEQAIILYKDASSFNNQYAKNNLAIIYKNRIAQNDDYAIELLNEAIKQKKDILAMYNLANIFHYYNEKYKKDEKIIIDLLVNSTIGGFLPAKELLCLFLISKSSFKIENVKEKLDKYDISDELTSSILNIINEQNLSDESTFNYWHKYYQNFYFLYNSHIEIIPSSIISKSFKVKTIPEISTEFYKGFQC